MIEARHIIYGRVEYEYSRERRSGYQVVYSSSDIKEEDVQAVEKQVQCFQYRRNMSLCRHQFFWTPTRMAAIVKSTPVISDPEIIDKAERGGVFVAHAILLTEEAFKQIQYDPFAVFEQLSEVFTNSPIQLKTYLKDKPPTEKYTIDIRQQVHMPSSLSANEWLKMIEIAYGATKAQNRNLFIKGKDSEEIYKLLSTAIFLVEARNRVYCTFDSHIDECGTKPGTYWAVGGTTSNESGFTVLDLANPQFQALSPSATNINTPFSTWLKRLIQNNSLSNSWIEHVPSGQSLAWILATGEITTPNYLREDSGESFWSVNKQEFEKQFKEILAKSLNTTISQAFLPYILNHLSVVVRLTVLSRRQLPPHVLASYLFDWFCHQNPKLSDWKAVLNIAVMAEHPGLQLIASNKLHLSWAPVTNYLNRIENVRLKAIQGLARQEKADDMIVNLLRLIPPKWMIGPETACLVPRLCDEMVLGKMEIDVFVEFLYAILQNRGASALTSAFAKRVSQIPNTKTRKGLATLMLKEEDLPSGLKMTLQKLAD